MDFQKYLHEDDGKIHSSYDLAEAVAAFTQGSPLENKEEEVSILKFNNSAESKLGW